MERFDPKGRRITFDLWPYKENKRGYFLDFGVTYSFENEHVVQFSSAIVLEDCGVMHNVPLENVFFLDENFIKNDLEELYSGTDEEVRRELVEMGIDIDKAKESFLKTLAKCKRDKNSE